MQEIIEINIEELNNDIKFHIGDKLYFSPMDGTPFYNYMGVITAIHETLLTIDSQLFYEKIPFNIIGKNIRVNLNQTWRKDIPIGKGTINRRAFLQTKKDDWKIDRLLTNDNSVLISSDIKLSDDEKKFIEFGFRPLSMDDKWFLFWENNILHGIRSWTGIEMFRCFFEKEDIQWRVDKIQTNDEFCNELKLTTEGMRNLIELLIKGQLTLREKLNFDES